MRSLETAVTRLRREAPGSLTQGDIVNYMKRQRFACHQVTVSDFERGKYMPADPFLRHFSDAIGQKSDAVRKAWAKAHKDYLSRTAKAARARRR